MERSFAQFTQPLRLAKKPFARIIRVEFGTVSKLRTKDKDIGLEDKLRSLRNSIPKGDIDYNLWDRTNALQFLQLVLAKNVIAKVQAEKVSSQEELFKLKRTLLNLRRNPKIKLKLSKKEDTETYVQIALIRKLREHWSSWYKKPNDILNQ